LFSDDVCTGTRIRTQIKGFGDPYATVAPCPFLDFFLQTKYLADAKYFVL
jgi:hypothetical protein